jgi:hypothetical protein
MSKLISELSSLVENLFDVIGEGFVFILTAVLMVAFYALGLIS